ncbi:MAG: hypothetical protein A2Y15_09270 [Clostridiales bacterium GWF2_36_10]|nr:MAG: hypothetical protein A2Y15_09270 [Clostridiales bacterium GWF2_36_10]
MVQNAFELNQKEKNRFLQVLGSGSGSVHFHAYIIEGAYGVGKTDFALFCAAAILCRKPDRPCMACNSCMKVFSQAYPDLHFYGGESEKPITMKEVRELISSSILLPNDGDKKIYIIKQAHKMRSDTQNALLKIFEEPPQSVIIFLLTEKKEALLPTILSRGRLITLTGENDEIIKFLLEKKHKTASSDEIRAAVTAADGSIGQAELFISKESRESRKKALELLDLLFEGGKFDFYDRIISSKITREKLLDLLELLQRLFTDILEYKYGCRSLVILNAKEAEKYTSSLTKKAISQINESITDCKTTIEQSGNLNAAITNLSIRLWTHKG